MSDEIRDEKAATAGEPYAGSGWTTTKQAAKVLGVSRRSVQGYVRRGMLEAREEGEGVEKRFFVSIDSLNALRNRRNGEASSSGEFAGGSPQTGEAANPSENPGEALRHIVDRLEARTVEATELRVRLELTERAQSTLEERLAEERRGREEAERERDALRRRLEALPETRDEPRTAREAANEVVDVPEGPTEAQEDVQEEEEHSPIEDRPPAEETARRPWWARIFGG